MQLSKRTSPILAVIAAGVAAYLLAYFGGRTFYKEDPDLRVFTFSHRRTLNNTLFVAFTPIYHSERWIRSVVGARQVEFE